MDIFSRRSGARPRSARALLGPVVALVLAAGLTACGSDDADGTARDPARSTSPPHPSEAPTQTPTGTSGQASGSEEPGATTTIPATGSAGVADAVLVDATEGGGSPSPLAFALDTDRAVQDFAVGLHNGLPEEVAAAVADVAQAPADATPYGAVVSTGCEPPISVSIDAGEAGFEVAAKLPKSTVQCLAPVTYVVVFAAPEA